MLLLTIFYVNFVFNSKNVNTLNYCGGFSNSHIYYNSLEEFFYAFQTNYKPGFAKLNSKNFLKFLQVLHFYPYTGEESNIIPLLRCFKTGEFDKNFIKKNLGHRYPCKETFNEDSKRFSYFRRGIGYTRIFLLRKLMKEFQSYAYHQTLNAIRNDELFYFITLTSLIESIGIVYLRLLTEEPYYKKDHIFVKDFITYSATFLHSVNILYKMSMKEKMYMGVFKSFAIKNLKLLYTYMFAWNLSYDSISNEINDTNSHF